MKTIKSFYKKLAPLFIFLMNEKEPDSYIFYTRYFRM